MIVVCNTSPLTNLASIGKFDLLFRLFGSIHIPEGVWDELNARNQRWPGSLETENADWIQRHTVQNQSLVTALRKDLDQGESESIVLAMELDADILLLDEKEGRHTAQRFNIPILGVVGILLAAKSHQEIDKIRPLLDALRQRAGFYLSASLYQAVLHQADE